MPPQPPPVPPPALMEEIVEEILLRLPPDEPSSLVRASLVCKPWLRLISDPAFRRRYRKFHRKPLMLLGFFYNWTKPDRYSRCPDVRFVLTADFRPRNPQIHDFFVLDCRHGRVLLRRRGALPRNDIMVVWDSMTGSRRGIGEPVIPYMDYTAAVLCAEDGCNHVACHEGPFLVVFVGTDFGGITRACAYSSETGKWSAPAASRFPPYGLGGRGVEKKPSVLVGGALYFIFAMGETILKYDLGSHSLSAFDAPLLEYQRIFLTAEDGKLGFAHASSSAVKLWSREAGPDRVEVWSGPQVIRHNVLLPFEDPNKSLKVIGFVEGTDIIFATSRCSAYMIELKSQRSRKLNLSNRESTKLCGKERDILDLFPYMSFHNPPAATEAIDEGGKAGGEPDAE